MIKSNEKTLKIAAVCGFGVGTSIMLKINIEKVLKKLGIKGYVFTMDVSSASNADADFILTSPEYAKLLIGKTHIPIYEIKFFMNLDEVELAINKALKGN